MKLALIILSTVFSSAALAGSRSELEPKPQPTPHLHAASTKAAVGKDKELTVKGGAGSVTVESGSSNLVDRKSKQ